MKMVRDAGRQWPWLRSVFSLRMRAVLRQGWIVVAAWLLIVLCTISYLLPRVHWAEFSVYVAQPLLWASLALLTLKLWQPEVPDEVQAVRPRRPVGLARRLSRSLALHKLPADRWLIVAGALVGLFQVAILVIAGVLAGFGASPYSHGLATALNVWFIGTRLVGQELARWYLLRTLGRRSSLLGVTVAWLLLSAAGIPVASLGGVSEPGSVFRLVGGTILPTAGENMLATYLAAVGGPLPSLAYRGVLEAFEWLSPILPNLAWTFTAFLGTAVPAVGLLMVRDLADWRAPATGEADVDRPSSGTVWVLGAVLVVFLFWFNAGLFGVRPALVSGYSMAPTMVMGDVAIIRPVSPSEVQVGDVIRYRREGSSTLHRVVEVRGEGAGTTFITKGDNNNVEDVPVDQSQLEGKLVMNIPKVGWLPIAIKNLLSGEWLR